MSRRRDEPVRLTKIYTRGGDQGETSRGDGKRVPKTDPRIAAYGTVDDCIGYVSRLIEAGADEILFICQMGSVPQWAQLETIRNIGQHVIPHFRKG